MQICFDFANRMLLSNVLHDGVRWLEDAALCLCCTFVHRSVESAIVKVATDVDAAASQPGQEQKAVSKVKQKASVKSGFWVSLLISSRPQTTHE